MCVGSSCEIHFSLAVTLTEPSVLVFSLIFVINSYPPFKTLLKYVSGKPPLILDTFKQILPSRVLASPSVVLLSLQLTILSLPPPL